MASVPKITFRHCPECGLELGPSVQTGGLCPRCLIATAIEHLSTVDHPALNRPGGVGAVPSIDQLNRQLPAYEFIELLGRGGAGSVFRARQRSLNRIVAIKILHGAPSTKSDAVKRFSREAQILARLKHPRVVTVHDFGSLPEFQYIVMEYVAGPTLRELLRSQTVDRDALRIAERICEAVEHAHSMGVMHRDLKPENVLFDSFDDLDSLKVADFGISRLVGETDPNSHQTQTGFVVGTPFYAAPEQMVAHQPVDTRADTYSIGVILYEILAGQLPRGRFGPPSRHRRTPPGTDAIVLRCLESDPERRYPDVAALRSAIEDVRSGNRRRRQIMQVTLVPVLFAVIIAASWLLLGRGRTSDSARPQTTKQVPVAETPAKSNVPPPVPSGRDENSFEITQVRLYGFSPTSLEVRIEGKQLNDRLALREGSSLVWAVQTAGVHRVDTPFKTAARARTVQIADRLMLELNDSWPLEIFIAERWYKPTNGTRRLSNIVRVKESDVRSSPAPPAKSGANVRLP